MKREASGRVGVQGTEDASVDGCSEEITPGITGDKGRKPKGMMGVEVAEEESIMRWKVEHG